MNNLQKFMESVSQGFMSCPNVQSLYDIDTMMDEKIDAHLRQIMSELSGVIVERLAGELQERGYALDGHRIINGFTEGRE